MREAWSVIGWRSASYASENLGRGPAVETPASFQARLAASAIPALMPKPPSGIHTCAASPQMNTRRSRSLLATSRRATRILVGQELVLEVRPNAENRADHPVAIEMIQPGFSGIGEILHVPVLPVDGHRHAAAARIEREVEPSRLAGQQAPELWRPDVE